MRHPRKIYLRSRRFRPRRFAATPPAYKGRRPAQRRRAGFRQKIAAAKVRACSHSASRTARFSQASEISGKTPGGCLTVFLRTISKTRCCGPDGVEAFVFAIPVPPPPLARPAQQGRLDARPQARKRAAEGKKGKTVAHNLGI